MRHPQKVLGQTVVLVAVLILSSLAAGAFYAGTPVKVSAGPSAPALSALQILPSHPSIPRIPAPATRLPAAQDTPEGSPASSPAPEETRGATALQDAAADLAAGTGPAGMAPLRCALGTADAASCYAEPPAVSPATYTKAFGFQPTSPSLGILPPTVIGGGIAWDALRGVVVFFGGQNPETGALLNQTWDYEGGAWFNVTNPVAPPARAFAGMAYDGTIGAIVLVGGCGVTVCPLDDTWEDSYDTWTNVTTSANPLNLLGSGLYDPSLTQNGTNGLVLFGGCWDSSCSTLNDYTLYFSTNAVCPDSLDPCWWSYEGAVLGPAGRYYTSFVAYPAADYDLLYGGYSPVGGTGGTAGFNDTWEYDPTTYTWTDLTPLLFGTPYPSDAIFGMTLFYDPYNGVVFMYGGENATYDTLEDAFWAFDGAEWIDAAGLIVAPPWPMTFAEIASDPYDYVYPPVLAGGVNQSYVIGTNETWVFEPGVVTNASAIPTTVETNATVNFFSNVTGGSCDDDFYYGECFSTWYFGNNGVAVEGNISTTYTTAGTYTATLEGYDIYGVSNFSTVQITVTTFTVTASATPTTVAQGTSVTFAATPLGGTPGYNYTWHFSDGAVAFGTSVAHAFHVSGKEWGNVTVTDATGTEVNQSTSVDVVPPLSAAVSAVPSAGVDVGHSVSFSVTGSGGLMPYNFTWSVEGKTGYGPTYSLTPTAAGPITADVTVTDSLSSTVTKSITLTANPALSASPAASPNSTTTGSSITFASGVAGGTGPYTYGWEFGDGHSSSASAPSHSYASAGTYTVQLWVNDSGGGAVHGSITVTVTASSSGSGLGASVAGLPLWEWLAILVAVIVVVAAVVLVSRRKRGGSGSAPPPPPPSGAMSPPPPPPPG